MNDFYVVLNDFDVATRRVMKERNFKPEQAELFSEP